MSPNTESNYLLIQHFVRTYTCNSKTTGCMWMFYISNDALLSKMSIFCVTAGLKIQMARYICKHASQSLFHKPFLRIHVYSALRHITWDHTWKFSILNDCYSIRDILCVVQSCTGDPTGELRSETRIGHSLIYDIVCIYCTSVYTSLFGSQLCLTTKLAYLVTAWMYSGP